MGGAFCFARYAHTKRIGFGVGYAVCIGLAMAAKPNAAVAGIALLICALLHALLNRDWKIVLLAVGSILLGRGMLSLIESWYAARSGVVFRYDVTMTARLAMGMQDSMIAAGWYNGYTEMSCPPEMTLEKEKAQAAADIASRLTWMRENPALAAKFYREKLLTMWLDPAYESVWMGAVSDKTGTMNGLAHMIYRDDTPIRRAMTAYMNAAQNVVFALSAVGGARLMKKKDDMAALALPVTILGGALYHLIFEAKAQYAYPYMVYMLPLAAAMMLTLLVLCWCCFSATRLHFQSADRAPSWQPKLVWGCLAFYLIFLTALEMKLELWGLGLIILGFLLLARAVIIHVDWSLLLVFMVMFIDVHLLTQLPALHQVLSGVGQLSAGGLWLSTIGLSQFISNVPATILLLNYVPPSTLLAWAVNVGGFGLLPGSLANLIALRMASDRRIWWRFHLYSLPLLLWAALVGYALLLFIA
mgnify:CR=1 FL=1